MAVVGCLWSWLARVTDQAAEWMIDVVMLEAEGEQEFQQALDLFCRRSSQLYICFAADGTILRASATCTELLGYSAAEMRGRPAAEFLHLDDPRRSWADLLASVARGVPTEVQSRWLHRDGRSILLGWQLNRYTGPAGPPRVEGWARPVRPAPEPFGAHSRILDDAPVLRSAQLSSQIAYSLLNSPLHGVLVVSQSGRVSLVNPRVTLLTGFPAEELRRAPDWLALLVPDAEVRRKLSAQTEAALSRDGAAAIDLIITTRSGEQRPLRLGLVLLRLADRSPAGRVVLLDDAIRPVRGDDLAATIIDCLPLGVAVIDAGGMLLYGNSAHRRIFAESAGIAAPLLEQPAWQASGLSSWVRSAIALPLGRTALLEGVLLELDPARRLRVTVRAAPLHRDGYRRGLLLLSEDVSEQKALDDRLREMMRMETLGTMAGGIAHDYNNMLGAILGFAAVLVDTIPGHAPFHEDAQSILGIARQAPSLPRQLMSIGRSEQPRGPVALNRLVQDTVRLLRRTIPESIQIRLELAPDLLPLNGSTGQLEQCLLNLCLNARDSMPEGGTLTIATANVVVSEAEARARPEASAGRHIRLTVQDTGCGIEPALLQRVFEPFFTTKPEGTGLGLPMVRRTVHGHLGHLLVDSTPGQGTTIDIFLPVGAPDSVPQAGETEQSEGLAGNETVLVVDDAPALRRSLRRLLESRGYTVLEAGDAADAVEVFRRRKGEIALVLLDLVMPQLSATQVFGELRRIEPAAKVLLCSGHEEGKQVQELLAQGAAGFIAKPWEPAQLLRTIRRVLD